MVAASHALRLALLQTSLRRLDPMLGTGLRARVAIGGLRGLLSPGIPACFFLKLRPVMAGLRLQVDPRSDGRPGIQQLYAQAIGPVIQREDRGTVELLALPVELEVNASAKRCKSGAQLPTASTRIFALAAQNQGSLEIPAGAADTRCTCLSKQLGLQQFKGLTDCPSHSLIRSGPLKQDHYVAEARRSRS